MKLQIVAPVKQEPIYKASVHSTGRIAFTIDSANKFGIDISKSMILAVNIEDPEDTSIYGILSPVDDVNGYKIQKAGKYHSVNAKGFFLSAGYQYSKGDIQFTITEVKVDENTTALKFTPKVPMEQKLPF